jgi:hypothetical protein
MHDKPWLKSGIQRLDGADAALVREADALYREAIRGEMDWGGYGRTALEGAAGGAAGGAVGGAFFGGVGAAPGAAAGAAIGAAGNVAIKGLTDIWYGTRSNEDKAAWQAGDLEEKLGKLAGILQGQDPTLASMLTALGNQYKEFIDGHVQGRKSESFQQNRFNLNPEEMTQRFYEEHAQLAGLRQPQAAASSRFRRMAAAPPSNQNYFSAGPDGTASTPSQNYGNNPSAALGQFGTQMLTGAVGGSLGEYGVKKTLEHLYSPSLLKGLGSLKSMGVGLVGEWGAGMILDYLEGLQGAQKLFDNHAADVEKIIMEVNRLTNNDPQVVAAGNQVWSYVLEGKERLNQMLQKAQATPTQPQTATASTRFRRS